jgi:hypothetical protein
MAASSPELEAAADAYRKHDYVYVSAAAQLKVLAEQAETSRPEKIVRH